MRCRGDRITSCLNRSRHNRTSPRSWPARSAACWHFGRARAHLTGCARNWRERRTGIPFLDGPITANNPMGVHHAWGRTYKDMWQRYHAMNGRDERWQNGFDCQGLWVEVNVEKRPRFQQQARHRGERHAALHQPVQAARAEFGRAADRAVHPPGLLDGLERPGRVAHAGAEDRRGSRADPHARARRDCNPRHGRSNWWANWDRRRWPDRISPSATRTTIKSGAS